jgi:hypothetical protein
MRKWAKSTARATLLTAGFVALGAGPALADVTDGHGSVLGGNQVQAPISAPVDISGNAAAVLGHALAGSTGGATVHGGGGRGGARTSGAHSVLGGNQIQAPISAPVDICGNAVAVLGHAAAGCKGGAKVGTGHGGGYNGGYSGEQTSGRHSVGGGNQITAPVKAPVDICGNAGGNAVAGCEGGARVHGGSGRGGARTSGTHSVAGGNQVQAPVNAPVEICGNAVAVLGRAGAGCEGRSEIHGGGYAPGGGTSGRGSIGGGNQVTAPITAPIDVCGNAVAVLGRAYGSCGADDCISMTSAPAPRRLADLPQLPVDTSALRNGALPVTMGAMPALPKLPIRRAPVTPLSEPIVPGGLDGISLMSGRLSDGGQPGSGLPKLPGLPITADDAARTLPAVGVLPKPLPPQLPPLRAAAAESQAGIQRGALIALAIGGLLAASSAVIAEVRRLRRR